MRRRRGSRGPASPRGQRRRRLAVAGRTADVRLPRPGRQRSGAHRAEL